MRAPSCPSTGPAGTRVRYRVLWMAFLLAIITFLDRVCISIAAPFMMDDLGLTLVQMSLVFSAFTLAYSLFEVPSGWLGDVIGHAPGAHPHRVVVVRRSPRSPARPRATGRSSPSASCSAPARPGPSPTPSAASRNGSRCASGAWPTACCSSARASAARSPRRWRSRSSRCGGGARASSSSGSVGVVWAAVWYRTYRDTPAEHPAVDARGARLDHAGRAAAAPRDAGTPWARDPLEPEPLRDLRDVLRARLRALLLLHVAPHVSDPRARVLGPHRRLLLDAAVPAGRRAPTSPAAGAPIAWPGRAA